MIPSNTCLFLSDLSCFGLFFQRRMYETDICSSSEVKVKIAQSCPTLCDTMDIARSSVHGILQARILEWLAILFCRRSSWPKDWTCVSCTACRICCSLITLNVFWLTGIGNNLRSTNSKQTFSYWCLSDTCILILIPWLKWGSVRGIPSTQMKLECFKKQTDSLGFFFW